MNSAKLVILDLKSNLNIKENDCHYIKLSSGSINLINSKQLFIKKYLNRYYEKYKQKLIFNFKNKIRSSKVSFLQECEIFNLRNDKEIFINKLIVILIIKKFILKDSKLAKVITDDYFTYQVFKKMRFNVDYYGKTKKLYYFSFLKVLKFYLKSLLILLLIKFSKKKVLKKNYQNLYLSLYPNYYKDDNELFFKKKNDLKLNFLLTDETHLNTKLKDIKNKILNFNPTNTVNMENFIYFSDILILIFLLPYKIFKIFSDLDQKLIIENCDFSDFFKNYVNISIVNRLKLEIYNRSMSRFKKRFPDIKNFHYYMFEYSFGFFLARLFKKNFKKTKLIGYQHGIFSDNIMWLDIIKSDKKYLPNKILALNKFSLKDYKTKIKNNNIYLNKKINRIKKPFSFIKNRKNKNKILIFTGLHDAKDIYNLVLNKKKKNTKDTYYFKFHPRIKFNFLQNKSMKKIEKVNENFFSSVLISQTSSLVYDFINFNKKFNTIACDYRPSLTSSKFGRKYELVL